MKARRDYRNRRDVEVAVLDALVDRAEEGMTVFELRAAVDADIDAIEDALAELKSDDLIDVEQNDGRVRVLPADRVLPAGEADPAEETGWLDAIRDRLGL
jgi:hypothetical protein